MPYQIRIKRSGQPGAVPQGLSLGELAYNYADRRLYIGGPNGEIHEVAANAQIVVDAEPFTPPAPPAPPAPPPQPRDNYTTSGIRRRLLPFEG